MAWLKTIVSIVVIIALFIGLGAYGLKSELREPSLSGAVQEQHITVGALDRSFEFYLPQPVQEKPALIFVLHGSGGDGVQARSMSLYQFDQLADQRGAIIVYPNGSKKYWNDCRKSADYAANTENVDDPAFFSAMIDYFVRNHHVDPQRVYATGLSNGGHMVYRLGFEMPQRFAALAAMAANLPVADNFDCRMSGQPVSMAVINGTNDTVNPYNGGAVKVFGNTSRGAVRSTRDSVNYWAQLANARHIETLRLPEVDDESKTWVEREIYRGDNAIEVRLYTLHGSGHVIPTQTRAPIFSLMMRWLGGAAPDMQAAPELWEFFDGHRAAL